MLGLLPSLTELFLPLWLIIWLCHFWPYWEYIKVSNGVMIADASVYFDSWGGIAVKTMNLLSWLWKQLCSFVLSHYSTLIADVTLQQLPQPSLRPQWRGLAWPLTCLRRCWRWTSWPPATRTLRGVQTGAQSGRKNWGRKSSLSPLSGQKEQPTTANDKINK